MTTWERVTAAAGLLLCFCLGYTLLTTPPSVYEPLDHWVLVGAVVLPVPWLTSFVFAAREKRKRLHWVLWSELGVALLIVGYFFVQAYVLMHSRH